MMGVVRLVSFCGFSANVFLAKFRRWVCVRLGITPDWDVHSTVVFVISITYAHHITGKDAGKVDKNINRYLSQKLSRRTMAKFLIVVVKKFIKLQKKCKEIFCSSITISLQLESIKDMERTSEYLLVPTYWKKKKKYTPWYLINY